MAAGLISFMGTYPNDYRKIIAKDIMKYVSDSKIPHDSDF